MSWLEFLLDEDFSDAELIREVDRLEAEYLMTDVSDLELLRDIESIEEQQMWCKMSDLQCIQATEHAEEEFFNQFGVSNSQLMKDVNELEQHSSQLPLGHYHGPAKPIPFLQNEVVVLPASGPEVCEPNFDLGFHFDNDDDEPDNCVLFKVPEPVAVPKIIPVKKSIPTKPAKPEKPVHSFKEPCSDEEIKFMGQKKFAQETYKKICWVVNMFHSW